MSFNLPEQQDEDEFNFFNRFSVAPKPRKPLHPPHSKKKPVGKKRIVKKALVTQVDETQQQHKIDQPKNEVKIEEKAEEKLDSQSKQEEPKQEEQKLEEPKQEETKHEEPPALPKEEDPPRQRYRDMKGNMDDQDRSFDATHNDNFVAWITNGQTDFGLAEKHLFSK